MKKIALGHAAFPVILILLLSFPSYHASAQTNRGMAVSPEKLPQALGISPKDYFIPSSEKKVGVVHALEGTVIVIHGTTKEGYFAAAGDAVFEKDSLVTLAQSKCRIRFLDENVVTMAPETEFSVESFVDQREEGSKSSFFRMVKGRAMFYALRLFRYKDSRVTLATPTNTIGVRGTKFGAHVYYHENAKTASSGIQVADVENNIAPYLAQVGTGQVFTDCFSQDGVLDVDGRTISPGQMFSGRTGQVIPTPPDVIRSFQQATEIRTEGATGQPPDSGGTEGEAPPPPPVSVTGGVAPVFADIQANITSLVQVQTGQQIEQTLAPPPTGPLTGPLYGYFSILLLKSAHLTDPFFVYDAFLSSSDTDTFPRPPRLDQDLNAFAYAVVNTTDPDYLKVISPTGVPNRGEAHLEGVTDSGELERSWTKHYEGKYTYTQWGYWQASASTTFDMNSGAVFYQMAKDRVWFLEGNHVTTAAEMPSGNYSYSGNAFGTYYGPGGSAKLAGPFSSLVNFGSATIQNTSIQVSGEGRTVSILQSGSAPITSGANGNMFSFTNGVATIDGGTADLQVNGSLFGNRAQEIGGNWAVVDTVTEKGAVGIFSGKGTPQ